ncbi:uncharacterized protein LOC135385524 isoform X2 [Ornithodoros turicata]|uniref:uncharacterized protein LOC135385524 isoform X2 n=1 Tax=Ornithodoros turicata TaxID=34597 RepID=UPI00313983FA
MWFETWATCFSLLLVRAGAKDCKMSDAYNAKDYENTGFISAWNYVAGIIAGFLVSDIDTRMAFSSGNYNESTDPIEYVLGFQTSLNWASHLLLAVAGIQLVTAPIIYFIRSTGRCGGERVQNVTILYEHNIASYTLTIGCLLALILICYFLMISACTGAGKGLGFIQEKAHDMRSDLKLFLDNMNCFNIFLEADIKPTITNFRVAFSRGMESKFVTELSKKIREEMQQTDNSTGLYSIYGSTLARDLRANIDANMDDPNKASNAATLRDAALKCDALTAELWKDLMKRFDAIQDTVRDTAVDALNLVKTSEETVEQAIFARTREAGDSIMGQRGFFAGYGRDPEHSFESSKKIETALALVSSIIILSLDVALLLSLMMGSCTHDPFVVPTKRTKAAHYAGYATLCAAYTSLPASALLVYIASRVMVYAVSGEAAVCRPYNLGQPSWMDHLLTPPKPIKPTKADSIIEFVTSPRNFQLCNKTFGSTLVSDVDLLEKTESDFLRDVLLQNLTITGFSHNQNVLQALYGAITTLNVTLRDVTETAVPAERIALDYNTSKKIRVSKAVADMSMKLHNKLSLPFSTLDGVNDVIELGYKSLVDSKVNMLERSLAGIKENIMSTIGDCGALQRIYNSGFSVLCNMIIRNMNGQWVALLIIVLLLNYTCYTSFKLSKYFLRMDNVTYDEELEKLEGSEGSDRYTERTGSRSYLTESGMRSFREVSERDMSQLNRLGRMSKSTMQRLKRRRKKRRKPGEGQEPQERPTVIPSATGKEEGEASSSEQDKFDRIRRLSMGNRRKSMAVAGFDAFRRMSMKVLGGSPNSSAVGATDVRRQSTTQPIVPQAVPLTQPPFVSGGNVKDANIHAQEPQPPGSMASVDTVTSAKTRQYVVQPAVKFPDMGTGYVQSTDVYRNPERDPGSVRVQGTVTTASSTSTRSAGHAQITAVPMNPVRKHSAVPTDDMATSRSSFRDHSSVPVQGSRASVSSSRRISTIPAQGTVKFKDQPSSIHLTRESAFKSQLTSQGSLPVVGPTRMTPSATYSSLPNERYDNDNYAVREISHANESEDSFIEREYVAVPEMEFRS